MLHNQVGEIDGKKDITSIVEIGIEPVISQHSLKPFRQKRQFVEDEESLES